MEMKIPSNPRLLIVDDDDATIKTFARILTLEGFDVRTAATAESGLREIETGHPDAVIVDLRMPYINGLGLLYRMRACEPGRKMPVAIVTGDQCIDDAVLTEIRDLGAEVRYKPLWIEDLVDVARCPRRDPAPAETSPTRRRRAPEPRDGLEYVARTLHMKASKTIAIFGGLITVVTLGVWSATVSATGATGGQAAGGAQTGEYAAASLRTARPAAAAAAGRGVRVPVRCRASRSSELRAVFLRLRSHGPQGQHGLLREIARAERRRRSVGTARHGVPGVH